MLCQPTDDDDVSRQHIGHGVVRQGEEVQFPRCFNDAKYSHTAGRGKQHLDPCTKLPVVRQKTHVMPRESFFCYGVGG
jgi:hypothetical protein